jgi:hypothetical protein
MRVRKVRRFAITQPGAWIVSQVPCSERAADEIPLEVVSGMLGRVIRDTYERAPKRRSRGPYVLGPVTDVRRGSLNYEDYIRGIVRFWAKAQVMQVIEAA